MASEKKDWQDVKDKYKLTRPFKIFWLAIICLGVLFPAILSYMDKPNTPTSNTTTSNRNINQAVSSGTSEVDGLPVTGMVEMRGDFIVVIAKVKNNKSVAVRETLMLYVKDSLGGKHFVDAAYVKLNPGETGKSESSIKASDIDGPPPYVVVYEWKD